MPDTLQTTLPGRTLEQVTFNIGGLPYRYDTYDGKQYMVAPMVMMTEGVHEGSQGPLYYPKEHLGRNPSVWNHKPIIVNHPQENGQPKIACDPTVLDNRGVGLIFHTVYDDKLRAEAWFDPIKTKKVEPRIIEALEKGEMMEVSTGLFTENDKTEGEFGGEKYTAIATNYQPDHLAVLPDKIGACSIADGAGLLQTNEKRKLVKNDASKSTMSHSNLRDALREELRATKKPKVADPGHTGTDSTTGGAGPAETSSNYDSYSYVEDVYHDFFVYSDSQGKLYKQGYEAVGDKVSFKNDPSSVKRVTEYRSTLDGSFIGNSFTQVSLRELEMADDKTKKTPAPVANTHTDDSGTALTDGGGSPSTTAVLKTGGTAAPTIGKDQKANQLIMQGTFGFKEEDRAWLSGLDDARLDKFLAQNLVTPASPVAAAAQAAAQIVTPVPAALVNPDKPLELTGDGAVPKIGEPNTNQSTSTNGSTTLVANNTQTATAIPVAVTTIAPLTNEEREVMNEALELRKQVRTEMITTILANAANKFTKEFLEKSSNDVLKGVASLAVPAGAPVANQGAYFGLAGGAFPSQPILNDSIKKDFGTPLGVPRTVTEPLAKK